jgi:hypothetical protein
LTWITYNEPNFNNIANRLSLRHPQRESLEILARICEFLNIPNIADRETSLAAINKEFPTFTDFEREFPSLCFALATGVGKTRLKEIANFVHSQMQQYFWEETTGYSNPI